MPESVRYCIQSKAIYIQNSSFGWAASLLPLMHDSLSKVDTCSRKYITTDWVARSIYQQTAVLSPRQYRSEDGLTAIVTGTFSLYICQVFDNLGYAINCLFSMCRLYVPGTVLGYKR